MLFARMIAMSLIAATVSTWEGFSTTKGNVYLVSNAKSGDAYKVTFTKFHKDVY